MIRCLPMFALLLASPAYAQGSPDESFEPDQISESAEELRRGAPRVEKEDDVFDDTYAVVGIGVALGPDYEGSDDEKITPGAGIVGSVQGIGFSIRGPSLSVDLIDDPSGSDMTFRFGPTVRYRGGRSKVKDDAVERLGKIKGVVEAGISAGVGFKKLLTPADSLSLGVSVRQDVSGRGAGYSVTPRVGYLSPLGRGVVAGVQAAAVWINGKGARYYYSVSPEQSAASGLPAFRAKGGLKEVSLGTAIAFDLNNDFLDGGFAIGGGAQYARLHGSAARTPATSVRGNRHQWLFGGGVAYVF